MIYNIEGEKLSNAVTPEMYGAIGDGITDDTAAWQAAVNSGFNVVAASAAYRCGTINVTENIEIDCNNATFTCTADKLFNCTGTVTNTVQNAGNYVAYKNFAGRSGYTGLAMLKSTDNVITLRTYYYGGFVARFEDGVCHDKRPVGFTGVTIDEFDPITCIVRNVGTVTHPNNTDYNYTIYCTYGHNCVFENITNNGEKYSIVTLMKCLGCEIKFVNGYCTYTGSVTQYYPLEMLDSSECLTHHCDITSDWWHCLSTGGNYLCYDNVIEWCNFIVADNHYAIGDHENAIGTVVRNCQLSGCSLTGGGKIYNSKILSSPASRGDVPRLCRILLQPTNLSGVNSFVVENIDFITYSQSNNTENGIHVHPYPQTAGNNIVIEDVTIKDIRMSDYTNASYFRPFLWTFDAAEVSSATFNGVVTLDNVVGTHRVYDSALVSYGSTAKMVVNNCNPQNGNIFSFGYNADTCVHFPDVEIYDSQLLVRGVFTNLRMSNVRKPSSESTLGALRSGRGNILVANNIDRLANASILAFANAKVTNMSLNGYDNKLWLYAIVDSNVGNYYGYVGSSGIVHAALE